MEKEWFKHAVVGILQNPMYKDKVDPQIIDKIAHDPKIAEELKKSQRASERRYYKKMLKELYEESCMCDEWQQYVCKTCRRIARFQDKLSR